MGRLAARVEALRREKQGIAREIHTVINSARAMLADLGGSALTGREPATAPARRRRRKLSPEARARIAAAQKARWAKFHAERRKVR